MFMASKWGPNTYLCEVIQYWYLHHIPIHLARALRPEAFIASWRLSNSSIQILSCRFVWPCLEWDIHPNRRPGEETRNGQLQPEAVIPKGQDTRPPGLWLTSSCDVSWDLPLAVLVLQEIRPSYSSWWVQLEDGSKLSRVIHPAECSVFLGWHGLNPHGPTRAQL